MPRKFVGKRAAEEEVEDVSESEDVPTNDDGISNEEFEQVLKDFASPSTSESSAIAPEALAKGIKPHAGVLSLFSVALPATFAAMLVMIYYIRDPVELAFVGAVALVASFLFKTSLTLTAKAKFRTVVKALSAGGKAAGDRKPNPAGEAVWYSCFVNSVAFSMLFTLLYANVLPGLVVVLEEPRLENPFLFTGASLLVPAGLLYFLSTKYRLF